MSLSELLVILIICIFVIKPEDIPVIVAKLKELKLLITNIKHQILSQFEQVVNPLEQEDLKAETEQINFYLQRITDLGAIYKGDYSLIAVKKRYRQLIDQKIADETKSKKQ